MDSAELIDMIRDLETRPHDEREFVIDNDTPVWTLLTKYGSLIREKNISPEYCSAQQITFMSRTDGKLETALAHGRHRLNWRGHIFEVTISHNHETSTSSAHIYLIDTPACQAFEEFLRIARERSRLKGANDADKLVVRVFKGASWRETSRYPKRPLSSLVTGDNTVERMLVDMRKFVDSEEEYVSFGFAFKRNYLVIGPPGSGKTSLITVAASKLDLDLCSMAVTPGMSEEDIASRVSALNGNSLLVMEDIDVLCGAAASGNQSAIATLTALTGILDGALHKDKLITVMTSTQPEILDSVLTRIGRIDYTARLEHLKKKQLEMMTRRAFHGHDGCDALSKRLWDRIQRLPGPLSATVVAQFLFRHRDLDPADIGNELCDSISEGTSTKHIGDSMRTNAASVYM